MGKVRDPKCIVLDTCFVTDPIANTLIEQGHSIKWQGFDEVDLIISPKAQMTPPGRLAYVVKKLKEIVKEVKGA